MGSENSSQKLKSVGVFAKVVLSGVILRHTILTKFVFMSQWFLSSWLWWNYSEPVENQERSVSKEKRPTYMRDYKYIYGLGLDDERFLA